MENMTSLFEKTNLDFNLDANFSNFNLLNTKNDTTIFSIDSQDSTFTPKVIDVSNIKDLKQLIGSFLKDDAQVKYPKPFDESYQKILDLLEKGENPQSLFTKDIDDNLSTAYSAFINGHIDSLSKYEELLNALYFPMQLAYFSSDKECTISGNVIVQGESPVVINCKSMLFKNGGAIKSLTGLSIICDTMSKE